FVVATPSWCGPLRKVGQLSGPGGASFGAGSAANVDALTRASSRKGIENCKSSREDPALAIRARRRVQFTICNLRFFNLPSITALLERVHAVTFHPRAGD